MDDTRPTQWMQELRAAAACLDDVRTEAHDMVGMLPTSDERHFVLTVLRRDVNNALTGINTAIELLDRLEKL